jgi:hypothetical protein
MKHRVFMTLSVLAMMTVYGVALTYVIDLIIPPGFGQ